MRLLRGIMDRNTRDCTRECLPVVVPARVVAREGTRDDPGSTPQNGAMISFPKTFVVHEHSEEEKPGGETSVVLTVWLWIVESVSQMPRHSHRLVGSNLCGF